MITTFDIKLNLERSTVCTTLEDVYAPVDAGDTLKVNIQSLMPYISIGEPKKYYDTSNGTSVFINDGACRPSAKYSIPLLNYMEVTCERNSSFSDLYETIIIHDEEYKILPERTKLQVKFANSKLSHPMVNTDTFIDE